MMNWNRTYSVMRKEWWHITRDRFSFLLLLLSPVIALITMSYAFSVDIEHVSIGVMDRDQSSDSRQLIGQYTSTDALRLKKSFDNYEQVENAMMRGSVKAVAIIPEGFQQDINQATVPEVQIVVDGTDPNTAGHAIHHLTAHTESYIISRIQQQAAKVGIKLPSSPIDLIVRPWFNPSMRMTVSLIPAMVGVVLSTPAMAAALALAQEREWGTMEGLIASPVKKLELIVGKMVPYLAVGMISIPLCIATAVFGFDIPFRGNLALYLAISVIYLFSSMSISLLISVFASSQQVAIMASMLVFFISGFFLSGILIPYSLMGPMLQLEAFLFPTTHFVIISRGVFIKGIGWSTLQGSVLTLLVIGVVFVTLSVLMFKKKL